ncbi:hypothetical protein GQ457_02G031140 [Hibiscus cannabinus]
MKVGSQLIGNADKLWVYISWSNASRLWKGLGKLWDDIRCSVCWQIRDGWQTDFWWDLWLDGTEPLVNKYLLALPPSPLPVAAMLSPSGEWTKNQCFTTASAYQALGQPLLDNGFIMWHKIWRLNVHQRVRTFFWLTLHGKLITNVERILRHLTMGGMCPICSNGEEDLDHVSRSCVQAKAVWSHFVRCELQFDFYLGSFKTWLHKNIRGVWHDLPAEVWVHINADEVVGGFDGRTSIEGVVCDDLGEWLFGFARSLISCSVLVAEIWAAHDALMHPWRLGFRRIELELDNKIVVQILEGYSLAFADNALVARLHELLGRE